MSQTRTRQAAPGAGHISLFNLAAITLLALLAGLGLAYLIEALVPAPARPTVSAYAPPLIAKNIAGNELSVPRSWFSDPGQVADGFADQVDLALDVEFGDGAMHRVSVRLTPGSAAQASAYLLDQVYLHRFLANEVSGPLGLIGKPLRPSDGYQDETVWYDPLSPQPFVAKCSSHESGPVNACLRTVRVAGGLAVTYGFSERVLTQWPRFDSVMRPFLESIGAVEPL